MPDISGVVVQDVQNLDADELTVLSALSKRGALFTQGITAALDGRSPYDALLSLVCKGYVRSDSFVPIRQALDKDKAQKANTRQRAYARAQMLTSGRWELTRGVVTQPMEEQLMRAFDRSLVLCRETAPQLPWLKALETLRIWEYTGRVRRGYYVEGLSGAQFVREEDFTFVTAALARVDCPVIWLTAPDPAQPWGKYLPHLPGRSFMNLPGSVVCLCGGLPIIIFERQGQVMRLLGGADAPENELTADSIKDHTAAPISDQIAEALKEFVRHFSRRKFYSTRTSLTVKQYPPEAADTLLKAGFTRYMQDFVLYRNK
jgi:ATP-dependent Lhr-like helicase